MGQVVEGNIYAMIFSDREKEVMKDDWMIHNHPIGSSFSDADIKFGVDFGLKGMVVTNSQGIHIVEFMGINDNLRRSKFGNTLKNMHEGMTDKMIEGYEMDLISGIITGDEIKNAYYDNSIKVMEQLADHEVYGDYLDYEFIEW